MLPIRILMGLTLAAMMVIPPQVGASEYNKRPHLAPRMQAKVNKAIAKSWHQRGRGRESFERVGSGEGCGNQVVGDFSKLKRPPREVIIVAKDIININRNCRR